jgi:D-alanyl-D-alanine carboxypeptidase
MEQFMRIVAASLLLVCLIATASAQTGVQIDPIVRYTQPMLRSEPWPRVEIAAQAADRRLDGPAALALDHAWARAVAESGARGVSAALLLPEQGIWRAAYGQARVGSGSRMTVDTPLHAGSVGKIATAILIHQLIDEGRLSLGQTVGSFFPGWPAAQDATLDQLLTHTSGLYSFNWLEEVRNSERTLSPKELLRRVRDQASLFPPGEALSYNNTGYLMLALIAEGLRSAPYPQLLVERVLRPAGMAQTTAWIGGTWPDGAARGLEGGKEVAVHGTPHGAGALIATPADLCRLMSALLSGPIVSDASRSGLLERLYPMSAQGGLYAGRGIMWLETPDGPWLHHGGSIGPFKADLVYSPRRRAIAAVMRNDGGPTTPFVYALLTSLPDIESNQARTR